MKKTYVYRVYYNDDTQKLIEGKNFQEIVKKLNFTKNVLKIEFVTINS